MDWKFWKSDGGEDPLAGLDDDFDPGSFDDGDSAFPDPGRSGQAGGQAPDMSGNFEPPQQQPNFSPPPSQQQPQQSPQQGQGRDLHMELVLSKLDAIKGQLDNLSARIERLEQAGAQQQQNQQSQGRGPWYAQQ